MELMDSELSLLRGKVMGILSELSINYFPTSSFSGLKFYSIDLSNNNIRILQPHLLDNQTKLVLLNLSGNLLNAIQVNLASLTKLRYLDLSHNVLGDFDSGTFYQFVKTQRRITINLDNTIQPCTCALAKLHEWTSSS